MKKASYSSLALLSAGLVLPAFGDKVQFEQLPPAVQSAIRAKVGAEQIEDIDRETRQGKTVYEVAFKRNGQHTEIQVEDPGPAAPAPAQGTSLLDSRKISYNELPPSVKAVADQQLKGAEINDVDRMVKNGQVTYEIGYKRSGGAQQELRIAQDGTVLSSSSSSAATAAAQANASTARALAYADLPLNVRQVAESKLSHGGVSRVDQVFQNGQTSYQIGFQREDGQYQQLVIAQSGQVLSEQTFPNAAAAVGSAGSFQSGAASGQASAYSYVTSPVQLSNPEEMSRADLPSAVRVELRKHAQASDVQEVRRGEWRGRTVYQVGYRTDDNRYVEMQFDEKGQVVYDGRNAPRSSAPAKFLNNLGRALFDNK